MHATTVRLIFLRQRFKPSTQTLYSFVHNTRGQMNATRPCLCSDVRHPAVPRSLDFKGLMYSTILCLVR